MARGLRVWLLGALVVAFWALALYGAPRPLPLGMEAPPTQFSAARAHALLTRLLANEKPHPAGSARNVALHGRIRDELARLDVTAQTLTGMSCYAGRSAVSCGTVSDIVAEAMPGQGKALLLMAHLDSVAAGPGAGDDGSGVAIILETLRALKAQGAAGHPVLVLFTDGEEMGMLGASLFLRHPEWTAKVGMVINVEARGSSGPSYLFQTSRGDAKLIDLYAAGVMRPATSSLYGEIYKYLPNDTDLTPFLKAGLPGANFAFIGGGGDYHTPLDTATHLDPVSLQDQGDNVLGLARGLGAADFTTLKSGDAIYFDLLGMALPRLAIGFALPLALLSFIVIALAGWFSRRPAPRRLTAFVTPPLLVFGCVAIGFVLSAIAGLISGEADPSFAHPAALRIALASGCWAMALLTMRGANGTASWLWLAGLGIAAAIFAPGLSPYFIFPACVAALLLLLSIGFGRGLALFLAALAALLVWISLAANAEALMGLAAHPLFTVPVAFGLIALLPLMAAQKMGDGAWRASVLLALVVALGAAVTAGLQPAYSAAQPQRLNLRYVEKDDQSWWLADPVSHLPASLRAAAAFSTDPLVVDAWRGYAAPGGGVSQLPAPGVGLTRSRNAVALDLHGAPSASGMSLVVPEGLKSVTIGDVRVTPAPGRTSIACNTPDCVNAHVILEFSGPIPRSVLLVEQHQGLPANAAFLLKARGDLAVPSGEGDMSYTAEDVELPR